MGELLVYYLWLVEPSVRLLQTATRDRVECSDYIWEPKNEEGWGEGGGEGRGCMSIADRRAEQAAGDKGEAYASNVDGF